MNEDFAEYTKCKKCNSALIYCDCNCHFCGNRKECHCELHPLVLT